MYTRWGQYRPLRKCMALSLLAHLLLASYAATIQIVTPVPQPGRSESFAFRWATGRSIRRPAGGCLAEVQTRRAAVGGLPRRRRQPQPKGAGLERADNRAARPSRNAWSAPTIAALPGDPSLDASRWPTRSR